MDIKVKNNSFSIDIPIEELSFEEILYPHVLNSTISQRVVTLFDKFVTGTISVELKNASVEVSGNLHSSLPCKLKFSSLDTTINFVRLLEDKNATLYNQGRGYVLVSNLSLSEYMIAQEFVVNCLEGEMTLFIEDAIRKLKQLGEHYESNL